MGDLKYLQACIDNGYCLHGSKKRLAQIEPRQARCGSGRPEGNLKAVYAEKIEPVIPVIMALLDGKGVARYDGNGELLVVSGDKDRTFTPGYVHVLTRDYFEDRNGEWVSFTTIVPDEVVWVCPDILWECLRTGRLDLRIPIPYGW